MIRRRFAYLFAYGHCESMCLVSVKINIMILTCLEIFVILVSNVYSSY